MYVRTFYIILFSLLICQANANLAEKEIEPIKMDTTGDFITYISPYYVVSWSKNFPMMSYWNIESGGRSRKYLDKSLLRPGIGGLLIAN